MKKFFPRLHKNRRFKLKRLKQQDMGEGEEEEFINELEQDPELRSRINLYREGEQPLEDIKEVDETKEQEGREQEGKDKHAETDTEDNEDDWIDDVEVKLCELVEDIQIKE